MGGPAKLGAGSMPTSRMTCDQDQIGGLAVALTQIARLESNRDSRKTVRLSTATGLTSRSAVAPTRFLSATSPWHAKRRRTAIELPRRISTSTRSTISALITRAARAISRGRRRGRPHRPTSSWAHPRQIQEKLTRTASDPNGTMRIPFPRELQLTEPNPSSQRATHRAPQQIRYPLPIGNADRQTRTLAPLVGGVTGMRPPCTSRDGDRVRHCYGIPTLRYGSSKVCSATGGRRSLSCRFSEILQYRHRFHRASDAAADQDLPVLRLGTQPCGEA